MIILDLVFLLLGAFAFGIIVVKCIGEFIAYKRLERETRYLLEAEIQYWRKRAMDLEEEIIKSFEERNK